MALLVKLKNLIFGKARLTSSPESSARIMDLCLRLSLPYEKMSLDGEAFSLTLGQGKYKRLCRFLDKDGIEYDVKISGLPFFIGKYKRRYGLICGTVIIGAMIIMSGSHIWDIRVSGNSLLTSSEVKAELSAAGLNIGSRKNKKAVHKTVNTVLLNSEKIAWLSINMRGNVAYVDIREKAEKKNEVAVKASNIIAKRNGIIEYLQVMRGNAVVKEGDSVKEGDLIISGISEAVHGEIRTENAAGKAFAVTNYSFEIKIPLEYDKKVMSKPKILKKTVKFFSKYINIFRNYGNLGANCVTIEEENSLSLPGMPALPVSIITELASDCKTVSAHRSEKEASELAFFELERQISSAFSEGELLRKNITTEIGEKEFILKCEIICSENIGINVPIEN